MHCKIEKIINNNKDVGKRDENFIADYNSFTISEYFHKQRPQIGDGCSIMTDSLGTEAHLGKIGNHVIIGRGGGFDRDDGGSWIFRGEIPNIQVFKPVVI